MNQREIRLVDAFADQPAGGRPVAVVPGEPPSPTLRAAIASEFGTSGVVTREGDTLTYTDCDGSQAVVSAAVAGYAASEGLDAGSHEFAVDGSIAPPAPFLVDLDDDGQVRVEVGDCSSEQTDIDEEAVADALGIDPAALRDVGADLPLGQVDAFGGTLLAPVNFLQHLTGATVDSGRLADLLDTTDAQRLCVFTFDTLNAEREVHARIFDPLARGDERPASGVAAAACSAHLAEYSMFDGDRSEIRVESGFQMDRPATVTATLDSRPEVSGAALTVLDGTVTLPEDEDDEIIEL